MLHVCKHTLLGAAPGARKAYAAYHTPCLEPGTFGSVKAEHNDKHHWRIDMITRMTDSGVPLAHVGRRQEPRRI